MTTNSKTGYVNGSDLLLFVAGKAVGHCTSHTVTFNSETKDRAVKPVATADISAGLWKEKGITGLSISISAEGLLNYDEKEASYAALMDAWNTGKSVEVAAYERENTETPYLKGPFVIASLEMSAPAQDDVTFSISLENDGQPTVFESSVLTVNKGA